MSDIYTEKEILGDALSAQKATTALFNTAATECVHKDVHHVMMDILNEEHEIQQNVFDTMHTKGIYPTPSADDQKLQETKQQYSQCVK